MGTRTPNLNLWKPASTDHPDPTVDIAGNMDLLDAHTHSGTYVAGSVKLTVAAAAPSAPATHDLWLDTDDEPATTYTTEAQLVKTMVYDGQAVAVGARSTSKQAKTIIPPGVVADPLLRLTSEAAADFSFAYDLFNRTAATLGTSDSGDAWTQTAGAIRTVAGLASQASPALGFGYVDAKAGNGGAEIGFNGHATETSVAVVLTAFDTSNFYYVVFHASAGVNEVVLIRRLAGSDTTLKTWDYSAITPKINRGAFNRVRVTVLDRVFTVTVNGVTNGTTYTDADTTIGANTSPGSTRYGIGFTGDDDGSTISYFAAVPHSAAVGANLHGWSNQAGTPVRNLFKLFTPTLARTAAGRHAVNFNGTKQWLLHSDLPADDNVGTWIAVVNPSQNTDATNRTLFGASANGGMQLRMTTAGNVELLRQDTASLLTSQGVVRDSETSIVAFTLQANGDYVLYINGRPTDADRISAPSFSASTMTIGGKGSNATSAGASTELFSGLMFDVQRYDRVLSGAELRQVFDGLAAKTGAVLVSRLAGPTVRISLDRRLKGSNLHPSDAQFTAAGSGSIWTTVWGAGWNWTWVQRSIDRAFTAGANAFRIIGDISGVPLGTVSEATYLARQEQVIDYLATKEMVYYCCGGDPAPQHRLEASLTGVQSVLVNLAELCASKTNVVAMDILQEVNGAVLPDEILYPWMRSLARAVRDAAPNLPLTFSNPVADLGSGHAQMLQKSADIVRMLRVEDVVDFYDLHWYLSDAPTFTPAMIAPLLVGTDKPLVFGEYGSDRNSDGLSDGQRGAIYSTVASVVASDPRIMGAFNWAAVNDDYGLYDETTDTAQTDISPAFAAGPTTFVV